MEPTNNNTDQLNPSKETAVSQSSGPRKTVFKASEYKDAVKGARLYAREMNHEVALLACTEFGERVLRFHLVSKFDSDYYRAEIVKPTDPL